MAGKGKKTFVAGEVLLAQDVNDYLMDQSVMNFATSAARSSAIPTPTEGMTTYVQDRNQIETFDGAEYRGMSGLQLVKKQTVDTGVASVTVNDAFSATYENYKIIYTGGVGSTSGQPMSGGFPASGANYYNSLIFCSYSNTTVGAVNNNNTAAWTFLGYATSSHAFLNVDVLSPFAAKTSAFSASHMQSFTGGAAGTNTGFHNVATSYSSFFLTPVSGTLTGGTIYVYGYGT
jgi:hypothetical protein